MKTQSLDEITEIIIDESIKIHKRLGPGSHESVYEALLAKALVRRGLFVERQVLVRFESMGSFSTTHYGWTSSLNAES